MESERNPHIADKQITGARKTMRELGISLFDISVACRENIESVRRVLMPATCGRVGHARLLRIRSAIERCLAEKGWSGNAAALWDEYDHPLKEAA